MYIQRTNRFFYFLMCIIIVNIFFSTLYTMDWSTKTQITAIPLELLKTYCTTIKTMCEDIDDPNLLSIDDILSNINLLSQQHREYLILILNHIHKYKKINNTMPTVEDMVTFFTQLEVLSFTIEWNNESLISLLDLSHCLDIPLIENKNIAQSTALLAAYYIYKHKNIFYADALNNKNNNTPFKNTLLNLKNKNSETDIKKALQELNKYKDHTIIPSAILLDTNYTFSTVENKIYQKLYQSYIPDPFCIFYYSPDNKTIIVTRIIIEHFFHLFNAETSTLLHKLEGHTDWIKSLCYSPDSTKIASGSDDTTIRIWDVHSGKTIAQLTGHKNRVTSICYNPDGMTIASGSDDQTIRIWNTQTYQFMYNLIGYKSSIDNLCYSYDGTKLASGSHQKNVWVWDISTKKYALMTAHTQYIYALCYNSDNRFIASGTLKEILIWYPHSSKIYRTITLPKFFTKNNLQYSLSFSKNDNDLIITTIKNIITIKNPLGILTPKHQFWDQSLADITLALFAPQNSNTPSINNT